MLLAKIEPWMMLLLGMVLLTGIMLRKSYRYFGRRRRAGYSEPPIAAVPRPDGKWSGAQKDLLAQISRREVEMFELSRELTGTLDSKIIVLQELIAKSDRRIEELERLLQELRESRDR